MSNRFAAGLSGIGAAGGKAKAKAAAPEPEAPPVAAPGPVPRAPSRTNKVVISAYFDNAVRQQFAILAIKNDCSQAAMLAEALNLLFERYGEPPIAKA